MIAFHSTVANFALNALWQSSVIALATLIVAPLLRFAPPRLAHAILVVALLCSASTPWMHERIRPVSASRAAPVALSAANDPVGLRSLAMYGVQDHSFLPLLSLAYLAFGFAATVRLARSLRNAMIILRNASDRLPGEIAEAIDEMHLNRIRVKISAEIYAPVTIGRTIVLPATAADRHSLTAILRHEAAHVGRNDWLVQCAIEIATLPVSFNPLLAALKRRAAVAREIACDACAVDALGEPEQYARTLVAIAKTLAVPPCAVPFGGSLEERVRSLRQPRRPRLSATTSVIAAAAIAIATLTACRSPLRPFHGADHADLSGRWVLNRTRTKFGCVHPYEAFTQAVSQRGARLKSWQTRVRNGNYESINWNVETDGVRRPIAFGAHRGTAFARWENRVLILELQTTDGHWERTRAMLSSDRRSLICDGEVRERGRGGKFHFVFDRVAEGRRVVGATPADVMRISARES